MKIKLTNPLAEPFTHVELAEQVNVGTEEAPLYEWKYQEFKKGDVIDVSAQTAEHLILTRQAEKPER